MTTEWNSICRICSVPTEYEIFAKIPTYLHANSNESQNWQKPINVLLEETTGLKVSIDDGLPHNICALCISYLKHASSFREQSINNAMTLKAIQMLRQKNKKSNLPQKTQDKDTLLITAQELNYAENRQTDTNLLLNNKAADQKPNKVRKQLLNNFQVSTPPTKQHIEKQMRYLNLLFDKDTKAELRSQRNVTNFELNAGGSGGELYADEDFQTATSSDENESAAEGGGGGGDAGNGKHNIFSYKEKNFEEDDIMDLDELRSAITINIPESCKERKCRACFRRFMFDESFREHMDSCIEYKFLTYIEEINRLLDIRRSKAVSPHEFIRRMIFCLRKTCEWLKANCGDMLLPDLLQNNNEKTGGNRESEEKSSSSGEQKPLINEKHAAKLLSVETKKRNKLTETLLLKTNTTNIPQTHNFNFETSIDNLFIAPKPVSSGTATPISICNNILYEIERSQSRNSNNQNTFDSTICHQQLMKPIAVLATTTASTTQNTEIKINSRNNTAERVTFLQKLQQAAACQTLNANKTAITAPQTPLIAVRKDLLTQQTPHKVAHIKPNIPTTPFSARCNSCNIIFETLVSLELHNARHHNNIQHPPKPIAEPTDIDAERKKIIALFEDDSPEEV